MEEDEEVEGDGERKMKDEEEETKELGIIKDEMETVSRYY